MNIQTLMIERDIQVGEISLHVRDWQPETSKPDAPAFVLLHGLASNARTWDFIAPRLNAAGYRAFAVYQRGHGLSDKPDAGYDFATISRDLHRLIIKLGLKHPILAGQSWGGNVVLEAAVRYPEMVSGLVFVDGGFLDLSSRGSWEVVAEELRPPNLIDIPREQLAARIGQGHPDWVPDGVELTLGNFEHLPDGTVRPWLSLDHHMLILRAMYDQKVVALYPQVHMPVLICGADDGSGWAARKHAQVDAAQRLISNVDVRWLNGAHDLHVDQPEALVEAMLEFAA